MTLGLAGSEGHRSVDTICQPSARHAVRAAVTGRIRLQATYGSMKS